MSISPAKFVPREMKSTWIKIYSYKNKNMQGTIYNPFFEKEIVFENVMQLIFMLERISDSIFFPQKTMELRHFSENTSPADKTSFTFTTTSDFTDQTPVATFELEIMFRQNASWQGNIVITDQNLSSTFRSVLELLTLMDSILDKN